MLSPVFFQGELLQKQVLTRRLVPHYPFLTQRSRYRNPERGSKILPEVDSINIIGGFWGPLHLSQGTGSTLELGMSQPGS